MASPTHARRARKRVRVAVAASLGTILASGALFVGVQSATAGPSEDPSMNESFEAAAEKYDVPRDVLAAVGYGETHFDGHDGKPSQAHGFGVMHLVSNPSRHTLEQAAEITGESVTELRENTDANIHGGAAVLRAHADKLGLSAAERDDVDAWYQAVARYGGGKGTVARMYADDVYKILEKGVRGSTPDGERITVQGQAVHPEKGKPAAAGPAKQSPDYPDATWVPANGNNFAKGRNAKIDKIVVHVTQGSYAGTISWFQNPEAQVSSHYVVRSKDGAVTQMVRDADTAYHARSANASALGIEHEGYVDDPSWFTDSMYRSSAKLTRHLADKHSVPLDRKHIVGHNELPGNDHTDPGKHWNWDTYLKLVKG
ncbi:transglycosylase SLT domain-containing protein [Streptomyces sp. 891-h]|nr:transglycosylase SLT domain-containing protein [Streptomyces sp. 891-h]